MYNENYYAKYNHNSNNSDKAKNKNQYSLINENYNNCYDDKDTYKDHKIKSEEASNEIFNNKYFNSIGKFFAKFSFLNRYIRFNIRTKDKQYFKILYLLLVAQYAILSCIEVIPLKICVIILFCLPLSITLLFCDDIYTLHSSPDLNLLLTMELFSVLNNKLTVIEFIVTTIFLSYYKSSFKYNAMYEFKDLTLLTSLNQNQSNNDSSKLSIKFSKVNNVNNLNNASKLINSSKASKVVSSISKESNENLIKKKILYLLQDEELKQENRFKKCWYLLSEFNFYFIIASLSFTWFTYLSYLSKLRIEIFTLFLSETGIYSSSYDSNEKAVDFLMLLIFFSISNYQLLKSTLIIILDKISKNKFSKKIKLKIMITFMIGLVLSIITKYFFSVSFSNYLKILFFVILNFYLFSSSSRVYSLVIYLLIYFQTIMVNLVISYRCENNVFFKMNYFYYLYSSTVIVNSNKEVELHDEYKNQFCLVGSLKYLNILPLLSLIYMTAVIYDLKKVFQLEILNTNNISNEDNNEIQDNNNSNYNNNAKKVNNNSSTSTSTSKSLFIIETKYSHYFDYAYTKLYLLIFIIEIITIINIIFSELESENYSKSNYISQGTEVEVLNNIYPVYIWVILFNKLILCLFFLTKINFKVDENFLFKSFLNLYKVELDEKSLLENESLSSLNNKKVFLYDAVIFKIIKALFFQFSPNTSKNTLNELRLVCFVNSHIIGILVYLGSGSILM
jgi:hypothetical protein